MKTRMEQKDSFLQTMYVSIENEKLDVSADYCAYTRGGGIVKLLMIKQY